MRANENQKNQSDYFSILEVIDKIFPPIGEFDYTKISTDELITRFESKIKEIPYTIPSERIASATSLSLVMQV